MESHGAEETLPREFDLSNCIRIVDNDTIDQAFKLMVKMRIPANKQQLGRRLYHFGHNLLMVATFGIRSQYTFNYLAGKWKLCVYVMYSLKIQG